jgi:hypothetical protein
MQFLEKFEGREKNMLPISQTDSTKSSHVSLASVFAGKQLSFLLRRIFLNWKFVFNTFPPIDRREPKLYELPLTPLLNSEPTNRFRPTLLSKK